MPELTYLEAIRAALREEMHRDEKVILMGEDLEVSSLPSATSGFVKEFGKKRVRECPISELGFIGAAVGAAMAGFRPVVELRHMDFVTLAMDPIVNVAAKLRYMLNGQVRIPLVIRMPGGGYSRAGATHSQSLEAWFMQVPGLKVVAPSEPADAKGLLKTAIRDDNPVIFVDYKVLHRQKCPVPEGDHTVPFGRAAVKREGKDITLIGVGPQVGNCLKAAEELAKEGVAAEVLDPRSLHPLDADALAASVGKTGRCVVVEGSHLRCGIGAEIAALLQERVFDRLQAPIGRVAALDAPLPVAPKLEDFVLPSPGKVVEAAKRALRFRAMRA